MRPITEFGDGTHIKHIYQNGPDKHLTDRNNEIQMQNKLLFDKIRNIMERPAYQKAVLYDSKKVAALAVAPESTSDLLNMNGSGRSKNSFGNMFAETHEDLAHQHHLGAQVSNVHLPQ